MAKHNDPLASLPTIGVSCAVDGGCDFYGKVEVRASHPSIKLSPESARALGLQIIRAAERADWEAAEAQMAHARGEDPYRLLDDVQRAYNDQRARDKFRVS